MKRFAVILFAAVQIFCAGCGYTNTEKRDEVLRIHVRADSDSYQAQSVKYEVVNAIRYYLSGELGDADDYDDAYEAIKERTEIIAQIAAAVLRSKGFGYGATAVLTREYFDEKTCGDTVYESGEYDALIVRLGTGGGDNWWSVLYPDLGYTAQGGCYKSLIAETVRKFK